MTNSPLTRPEATGLPTVELRELQKNDLSRLSAWRNDPEQIAWLAGSFRHVSLDAEEQWFQSYVANRSTNLRLAICVPGNGMIGVAYLLHIDWIVRCAELAVWIGQADLRGKAIGQRATRLLIRHAFSDLNLQRLYLTVLTRNERAIRLYRKLGFKEEGIQRQAAFKQGRFEDLLAMGLLRSDYAFPLLPDVA